MIHLKEQLRRAQVNTPRLVIRTLKLEDITEDYVRWMNDPQVVRYLESRHSEQTLASIQSYVLQAWDLMERHLFGLFASGQHIGNISFEYVDWKNKTLRMGVSVGRNDFRRKGFALEALEGITHYIFESLHFNRIEAGALVSNQAACGLFEKAGFSAETTFRERGYFEGSFVDWKLFVYLKRNYSKLPSLTL